MGDPRSGRTEAAAAGEGGGVTRNNSTDAGRPVSAAPSSLSVARLHPQTSAESASAERPPWPRGCIPLLPVGPSLAR